MKFYNEKELYNTIGANIKYFREKSGLTQLDLSEKSKISISYISKIEAPSCNKSISIAVLNHIANTLNVDIIEFFERRI